MSALADLSTTAVLDAQAGQQFVPPEQARALVRALAWALFRHYGDLSVRVRLFWGISWTVRLGDLRPLWEAIFGPEPSGEAPTP